MILFAPCCPTPPANQTPEQESVPASHPWLNRSSLLPSSSCWKAARLRGRRADGIRGSGAGACGRGRSVRLCDAAF